MKEELERLQKQQIIVPLGMDETSEWCNSFVLISKVNCKERLCLDAARLNEALIRSVHRGPTLNDILLNIEDIKHLAVISASSGYHKLKIDRRPLYLTLFLVHEADIDAKDYHYEQLQLETCSRRR